MYSSRYLQLNASSFSLLLTMYFNWLPASLRTTLNQREPGARHHSHHNLRAVQHGTLNSLVEMLSVDRLLDHEQFSGVASRGASGESAATVQPVLVRVSGWKLGSASLGGVTAVI